MKPTVQLNLRIAHDVRLTLEELAADRGETLTATVEALIAEEIKRRWRRAKRATR